jgi:hypothetical protein
LEKPFAINAKSAFIVMLDAYSLLQKMDLKITTSLLFEKTLI